jgi:hypothetical protein
VKSLKSSDMFAVIAAPEIEEAFIQVRFASPIVLADDRCRCVELHQSVS